MKRVAIALVAGVVVAAALVPAATTTSGSGVCAAFERSPGRARAATVLPPASDTAIGRWIDRCVRLNEIQVVGTHNSYKQMPATLLMMMVRGFGEIRIGSVVFSANEIEYGHLPLAEQLDLGVRQFELDIFADPHGGLFSSPAGQRLFPGDPPVDPEGTLAAPGLKVLHIQDLDFRTSCLTFIACLTQMRRWSDAHPRHLPIMIMVEAKDAIIPDPLGLGFATPVQFGPAELDTIDAEIRSVFPPAKLITPDDVRGNSPTLRDAVTARGWPTLGESRGRFLFTLIGSRGPQEIYLAGRPSAEGRVLFPDVAPPSPAAAFVAVDNVLENFDRIRQLVAAGFVVRTRTDIPTIEARSGNTTRRDRALASGAQWVSTDYPLPSPFGSGYVVTMPGGGTMRCNPVATWAGCRSDFLER